MLDTNTNIKEMIIGETYTIDPRDIIVIEDENPRKKYGEGQDWDAFKDSIRNDGLHQHIKLTYDEKTGKLKLAHGFRRMRAINQIVSEDGITENSKLKSIKFELVSNNPKEIQALHFKMNSGLEMTDLEKAKGLKKLENMTGETNIAELARMTDMPYQKVFVLLDFIKKSGIMLQNAIEDGRISFTSAYQDIVKRSGSVTEQNQILKDSIEKVQKNGKTKLKVNKPTSSKRSDKADFHVKLGNVLVDAMISPNTDKNVLERVKRLVKAIDMGEDNLIRFFDKNYDINE